MLGNLELRESLSEVMNKIRIFITDDSPLLDSQRSFIPFYNKDVVITIIKDDREANQTSESVVFVPSHSVSLIL